MKVGERTVVRETWSVESSESTGRNWVTRVYPWRLPLRWGQKLRDWGLGGAGDKTREKVSWGTRQNRNMVVFTHHPGTFPFGKITTHCYLTLVHFYVLFNKMNISAVGSFTVPGLKIAAYREGVQ
jgi:hypothetical protein